MTQDKNTPIHQPQIGDVYSLELPSIRALLHNGDIGITWPGQDWISIIPAAYFFSYATLVGAGKFAKGDRVKYWDDYRSELVFTIMAIDGNEAWMKDDVGNRLTARLSSLRLADEATP